MNKKSFPDRWLFWTCSIIIFVGIVVCGYIQYAIINNETQVGEQASIVTNLKKPAAGTVQTEGGQM